MTPESQRNLPASFMRMGELFNAMRKTDLRGHSLEHANYREIALSDGTMINLDMTRPSDTSPIKSYNFSWETSGKECSFVIENDGRVRVRKSSAVELKVGDITMIKDDSGRSFKCKKEDCEKVSGILIDWAEKIMKENKFSPPPIAIVE